MLILYGVIAGIGLLSGGVLFLYGYRKGKIDLENRMARRAIKEAREANSRRAERSCDSDDVIDERLREFSRK